MRSLLITTQRVDTEDPILQFFQDWIREFAKQYDRVYVICLQAGEHDLPDNVIVKSLGKEAGASRVKYIFNFYRYVIPLLARGKVQKIFVHMNEIYVLLLIPLYPLRWMYGLKTVWWKTQAKLGTFAKLMRFFVTRIFTASEHGYKVETRKKFISGHGINTEYFTPGDRTAGEVVRMAAVGRAIPVKGYDLIVEAAGVLKQQTDQFSIDIIGVRPEDRNEYVAELEKRITELNVTEQVRLHPPVPFTEMVTAYRNHDVVINATFPYSFDKVLLEAMATGCIPITPTPSYADILTPHGLFPTEHTAESLAAVFQKLVTLTPHERQAIGSAMRSHIIERHNVVTLIQKISDF